MPTYEYRRKDGSIFEIRQGINDSPLTKCPETGQSVTRMISGGAGVVYKGDGWYVKEYKNSKPGSSEPTSEPPKKAEGDTKPATAEVKKSDTSTST